MRSVLATTMALLTAATAAAAAHADEPVRTIIWLSIDGIRPDYIERGTTPIIDRLMHEGAYSMELIPVFPSLTFPSHVSKATGVKVAQHGVPGNSFITNTDWFIHRYPSNSQLLQAEPIWNTATRQGLRVLVHDWPLSHAQRGEHATAHHGERYIRNLTDDQRLKLVLDTWEKDFVERGEDERPLQLLMGYAVGPDSLGHEFGPDADQPVAKLEEVDELLRQFLNRAHQIWEKHRQPDDELYVLLTTDHGMSPVHTIVHLENMAGIGPDDDLPTMTSGNIGHIYLKDLEADERQRSLQWFLDRINAFDFATAYSRDDLPDYWQYNHPQRVGDIVVVLDVGYTFSRRADGVTAPVTDDSRSPRGMHGYDPRTNPEMLGFMVLWRFPTPLGGSNLGQVHSLQLHATIADLLGIEPADGARADTVRIPNVRQPATSATP